MAKWNGNLINSFSRYRTQSGSQARGIYSLDEQLQHERNSNWPGPFAGWPSETGRRIAVTILTDTTSGDDSSAFKTHHEDMDAAAATGTTGRLYFAIKVTANTAYYNDFCIGAVQLTSDDYNTLEHGWSFNVLADYNDWEYATVTGLNTTSAGYENYSDIIGATSQNWTTPLNSIANARISRASGTGSSFTGATDGVSSSYSETAGASIIDDGTATIAQSGSAYYMFTESSGTSANVVNKWFWVRSEEVSLNGEDDKNICIVYHAATPASNGMTDAADEPLFRWWWIPS